MMEGVVHQPRGPRGRGSPFGAGDAARGRGQSRNKHWSPGDGLSRPDSVNGHSSDGERWERGGNRGGRGLRGGRGTSQRRFPNQTLRVAQPVDHTEDLVEEAVQEQEEKEPESPEEREKFYQELVKGRETERKKAIAEGKMDDPAVPKRLEDAITMVGTCKDMCPRFERYRRERENNLFEWEMIPGTKRVDHKRAVKMYERAAGDKTLPSDLRPPVVLKKTLDYLFHDLLPRGGFSQTFNFIRDRSRAVRNDFTMQHQTGPLAIECHDRCARFHILSIHHERNRSDFSIPLEEQQLMNTLQSLKEFYDDQRGRYESPTELEMRVYHRLIHIRDQRERKEDIPEHIIGHPVFKLTTQFRLHVQHKSAPISKTSALVVDADGMRIFGQLASTLKEQGNIVMIYLVACILERHFGQGAIDNIEEIRGGLSISDIIDGVIQEVGGDIEDEHSEFHDEAMYDDDMGAAANEEDPGNTVTPPITFNATDWHSSFSAPPSTFQPLSASSSSSLAPTPAPAPSSTHSAFSNLVTTPNAFSNSSVFGAGFSVTQPSLFGPKPVSTIQLPTTTSAPPVFSSTSTPISAPQAVPPIPPDVVLSKPATSFFSQPPLTNIFPPSSHTPSPTKPIFPSTSTPFPQSFFPSTSATPPSNIFPKPSTPQPQPLPTAPQAIAQEVKPLAWNIPKTLDPGAPVFTPTFGPFGTPSTSSTPPLFSTPPSSSTAVTERNAETPSLLAPPIRKRKSSTPPVPRIDTQAASNIFSNLPLATPNEPPALSRPRPIALPETPTSTVPGQASLTPFLKRNFETPPASSKAGLLSPLNLSSPSIPGPSSLGYFGNITSPTKKTPSASLLVPSDKGKAPEKNIDEEELERRMLEFAQKSLCVKESFQHWRDRALEQAAWREACRQSEAYRLKIQHERSSQTPAADRKRRVSTSTANSEPVERKRAKKRTSSTYQAPRTDEELARRLKENHEEYERRWARGTLLSTLRNHIKPQMKSSSLLSSAWRTWVSINLAVDSTAIWIEGKFDIPDSGTWESQQVFSIPVSPRDLPTFEQRSPGLVIFECTPLGGITDEIERKYRILDDSSRLRDVITSLPPKRMFTPALLVVEWADNTHAEESEHDFFRLVKRYIDEGTLLDHRVLRTTAQDAEEQFASTLASLTLDVAGRLGRETTIRALVKVLEPSFGTFASEWLDNCIVYGEFDWGLYARVLQVLITALNEISALVANLLEVSPLDFLPIFDTSDIHDSSSAYEHVGAWLANADLEQEAEQILATLHAYNDMGKEFPSHVFVDHLRDMTITLTEQHLSTNGDTSTKYLVQEEAIDTAIDQYLAALETYRDELSLALSLRIRRSPKRRGYSEDTDSISQASKRRRFSSSALSESESMPPPSNPVSVTSSPPNTTNGINGSGSNHEAVPPDSPTMLTASIAPSDSTSTAGSVVTVSMLRQLTRDMKKKYSSTSLTLT